MNYIFFDIIISGITDRPLYTRYLSYIYEYYIRRVSKTLSFIAISLLCNFLYLESQTNECQYFIK